LAIFPQNKSSNIIMKAILKIFFLVQIFFFFSCSQKTDVDMILFNGNIQTLDSLYPNIQSIAIQEGIIKAIGSNEEVKDLFKSQNVINLKGKFVYPGFMDAHSHFYGYAKSLIQVNLRGA